MISRQMKIALIVLTLVAIFLAFYNRALKKHAERLQQKMADMRPIAPPVTAPMQTVTMWVAHDDDGALHAQQVRLALPAEPGQRARELLRALFSIYLDRRSSHPIGDGSDVKDVYLLEGNALVVDLNAAFGDEHRSGIFVEELTLLSMVKTLSANIPDITRVKFLVDGKERETLAGHADLRQFYDVGLVSESVKELH